MKYDVDLFNCFPTYQFNKKRRKGTSKEDDLLPNAAKIDTALILINSQRSMIVL